MATDATIAQFEGITGCTGAGQARHFLDACAGDVQKAVSMYFDTGGAVPTAAAAPPPAAAAAASGGGSTAAPRPKGGTGRISDFSSSADKGQNEYFAGGGKDSGTAIIGPGGGGPSYDVSSFMDDIKAHGGRSKEDDASGRSGGYAGGGHRLGMTAGAGGGAAAGGDGGGGGVKEKAVTITFWRDGFSVDDGPLQDPETPEGKAFLADVRKGTIPMPLQRALREEFVGQTELPELVIHVMDKKGESYSPPPKQFKAFAGEGRSMKDSSPAAAAAAPAAAAGGGARPAPPKLSVDAAKETTSVVAQLPDGTRLTVTLNVDHTLQDLRDFVLHSRPGMADFELMTTFPRKVLSDMAATIAGAGLKKAVVVVKPK